jgi:hypothetical protein
VEVQQRGHEVGSPIESHLQRAPQDPPGHLHNAKSLLNRHALAGVDKVEVVIFSRHNHVVVPRLQGAVCADEHSFWESNRVYLSPHGRPLPRS